MLPPSLLLSSRIHGVTFANHVRRCATGRYNGRHDFTVAVGNTVKRLFLCFFIFTRLPRTCICSRLKEKRSILPESLLIQILGSSLRRPKTPPQSCPKIHTKNKTYIIENHNGYEERSGSHAQQFSCRLQACRTRPLHPADFSIVSNPSATNFPARNCNNNSTTNFGVLH